MRRVRIAAAIFAAALLLSLYSGLVLREVQSAFYSRISACERASDTLSLQKEHKKLLAVQKDSQQYLFLFAGSRLSSSLNDEVARLSFLLSQNEIASYKKHLFELRLSADRLTGKSFF